MNDDSPISTKSPPPQFRGRMSRTVLLIFLPLLLIPFLLMGGLTYYRVYMFLQSQMISLLSSAVEAQSNELIQQVSNNEKFLEELTRHPDFAPHLKTILQKEVDEGSFADARKAMLNKYEEELTKQSVRSFEQVLVVLPDNTILLASNERLEGYNLKGVELEEMIGVQKSKAFINTTPLYRSRYIIYTAYPIRNSQDQVIATVIGAHDPNARQKLINAASFNDKALAYYILGNGTYVGTTEFDKDIDRLQPSKSQAETLAPEIIRAKKHSIEQFLSFKGTQVLSYVRWMEEIESGLVVEIPRSIIQAPMNEIIPFAIIVLAGTMFFIVIVILFATRRQVRPIVELSKTALKFSEGDWSIRSEVNRKDEIGLLAHSYNRMADELSGLYHSLESRVEEIKRQIWTAAEVAQAATSASSLSELLSRTVNLIVERFGYYDASIFLIDEPGVYAVLEKSAENVVHARNEGEYKLAVGSQSMIGWVTANNEYRISANVDTDPLYLKDEQLPDTRSELVIPLSIGDLVLGALDVHSNKLDDFNSEDITILQTLANQIATAIRNTRLLEATEINLEEASLLYHASQQITQAANEYEIYEVIAHVLSQTSYIYALFTANGKGMEMFDVSGAVLENNLIPIDPSKVDALIPVSDRYRITSPEKGILIPEEFRELLAGWMCESVAFLPIRIGKDLKGLIILASHARNSISNMSIQPYLNLVDLTTAAIDKIAARRDMEKRLQELVTISEIGQAVASQTDLQSLFEVIHNGIRRAFGNINFVVALYETETNMIHIPYLYEGEDVVHIDPFPLGEGLTTIVLRTSQPLLLNDIDEETLRKFGAKIAGKPARSWLGVPLIVGGQTIGALVIQDLEHAHRFSEDDVRMLNTMAVQVAVSIRNTRLLEQTRRQAQHERLLHETTSKIRSSVDIQHILETTAKELSKAIGARRAHIEIGTDEVILSGQNGGEEITQ